MIFDSLDKHRDKGLLILRIGIGAAFMCHGFPKLTGGPDKWAGLGGALSALGLSFAPMLMGFMAAISEFGGGLLLALGLAARPAAFFLLMTMVVATAMHVSSGDTFMRYSHALEAGILFLGLVIMGPGKYSLDAKLSR
jgi:putative oxidoreductase